MCLTEYNEVEAFKIAREASKEEGIEEGKEKKEVANLKSLVKKLKVSIEEAMDLLEVPEHQRSHYKNLVLST